MTLLKYKIDKMSSLQKPLYFIVTLLAGLVNHYGAKICHFPVFGQKESAAELTTAQSG